MNDICYCGYLDYFNGTVCNHYAEGTKEWQAYQWGVEHAQWVERVSAEM